MKKYLMIIATGLFMVSCATTEKPLYSWYDSEDATYQYTKKGEEKLLIKAMEQYEMVIKKQKGTRGIVPPGANAEYGFFLFKAGKKEEGLALLKEEMNLYPESEKFISRIIKQLEKNNTTKNQ
jgi:hypothetical protein